MRVIICGAGQVGSQIARHLSQERNNVTVIDNNGALVRRATETLDVQGVIGFASYPDVLDKAGASDADMIIAATQSDEVNMVTCQVAHSVFGVPRKIARLRGRSYLDVIYSDLYRRDHLPIDVVISPEKEVAEAAIDRLKIPAAFDSETFLEGKSQMLGIVVDEGAAVSNTPLNQLTELFSTLRSVVVGVRRDGRLFAPEPSDQIYTGDSLYLMVDSRDVDRTLEIFGKTQRRGDRSILVGAGAVGREIAIKLENGTPRTRVKVIERDRRTAEAAADILERSIVLNGDGLDRDILEEANIRRADSFIAVTDDDKTNLLSCARAKAFGCPMVIALVNDPSMQELVPHLGIDATINPRAVTVSSILRHIRHGKVRQVYSIGDGEAEIFEAQVLATSEIAGKSLSEVNFPEGALVGGILKGEQLVMPRGSTRIEVGDILAVFCMKEDIAQVEALFQVGIDFF
ncbi:Trk system potassium transporter TrkA [Paracoccaceae bacterium GXU_MW_L88]